jgi:hypothetical protein
MTTLNDLLGRPTTTLADVQSHLASLAPEERVKQATSIDMKRQGRLWALAEGGRSVGFEELVPASTPDLEPVPFQGQNSQPLFRNFRKVFYRLPDGRIGGRNEGVLAPVIGDGYYVVERGDIETYVDYTQVPNKAPSGWPRPRRNDRGVSILVFGFMKDYLRRVTEGVFIGHALKPVVGSQGYFVLARA